jgi:hypothetical protein
VISLSSIHLLATERAMLFSPCVACFFGRRISEHDRLVYLPVVRAVVLNAISDDCQGPTPPVIVDPTDIFSDYPNE